MSAEGAQVVGEEEVAAPEVQAQGEADGAGAALAPVERAEHPGGEAFFSGEGTSDAEAEEVARQQLLRSGLLRGQRVRVGD
jgi:hypothetical protein